MRLVSDLLTLQLSNSKSQTSPNKISLDGWIVGWNWGRGMQGWGSVKWTQALKHFYLRHAHNAWQCLWYVKCRKSQWISATWKQNFLFSHNLPQGKDWFSFLHNCTLKPKWLPLHMDKEFLSAHSPTQRLTMLACSLSRLLWHIRGQPLRVGTSSTFPFKIAEAGTCLNCVSLCKNGYSQNAFFIFIFITHISMVVNQKVCSRCFSVPNTLHHWNCFCSLLKKLYAKSHPVPEVGPS